MNTFRCLAACSALLGTAALLLADPAVPPTPAASLLNAASRQSVLDGLKGKPAVIGFTVHDGTRYLGRVLSGDHGLYVVQTFHYVSAPATTPVTTTQTTYVAGRNGRMRPVTKRVTTQVTSQKTIADDTAVKALLSGVAGASARPQEQPAKRELVAPSDIVCLQQLLPPPAGKSEWTIQTLWPAPK